MWARSRRTENAWKVQTVGRASFAKPGSIWLTRSCISRAALLVNVTARIDSDGTPATRASHAIRDTITRVLPEPAPAKIISGPPGQVAPSRCSGLREERSKLLTCGVRAEKGGTVVVPNAATLRESETLALRL